MKLGMNRWHVAAWLVVLCLTATTVALALLGDVNSDGLVNGTDAQQVLESVVGTRTFTPAQQANADVDGDGDVDVADAQFIRQFASGAIAAFPARLPSNSSPIAVTRKGDVVGVVHPDGNRVAFLATSTDSVIGQVAVGSEPNGVAFSRDGKRAYVTIAREAKVSVIDTTTFTVVRDIPVGVEPFGVVVNFRGDRAYVSNMASSTVSVINLASETVTATVPVAGKPQGLAVTSGSDKVFVTHLNGTQVSVIDAATLGVTTIALADLPFDEFNPTQPSGKANRMKGIAIHPTSARAWLPHQLSNSGNFVETLFNTTIFPAVSVVDTASNTLVSGERMTLFSGLATVVSSPEAVAFAPNGLKAYVVSAASNDLTILNVSTRQQVGLIRDVGDNPRGIVVTPNGTKAYVFNRLTPQVSVVSLASESLLYNVAVGADPLPLKLANGRRLFFSSATPDVAKDRFFSCEACHFDGRDDGQSWLFTNGPRQSLSMAGGTLQTGLLHHNADRLNVQDFAFTFTRLQNGTGVTPDQLNDLAEFVNSGIRFLGNPFVNPDLSRTAAGRRGRRIFRDPVVGCASCHSGAFLTDATGHVDPANPMLHNVGTFVAGTHTQDAFDKTRDQEGIAAGTVRPAGSFESTSLLGVFATAPYLHDGRSATLLDTLTTGNPGNQHGVTSSLTAPQKSDLVAYLQQLDITQARVQIALPADNARVASLTKVTGPVLSDVVSVNVYVNGAGPIAATIASGVFTALVPPGMVPALSPGQRFEIKALATTSDGQAGRDDIDVEANFGATPSLATSTVDAVPALIHADGVSTATMIITPRDGSGVAVGTGLNVQAQATSGTLAPVVDMGDGTYTAKLTSSVVVVTSTLSARIGAGSFFTDTAQVQFAAGSVDAIASAAVVAPTTLEANGVSTAVVTITPRDAFSNNLGAGQTVGVSTNKGTLSAVADQGNGTYTATYKAATTTGTGTITATVNGVTLGTTPTVTLVPDVTAPAVADLAKIGFAAPSGGSSLVTGGAGSVEGLATVRADNTSRVSVFATAVAAADGSFTLTLPLTSNETVCFKVTDLAGNMSASVCKVPFPVTVLAVHGFVKTPHAGSGFDPVAGAAVQLDLANVTNPLAPSFTQLFISGAYLTSTTAADGSYTIVVPVGFTFDPNHAVVTGPDANHDGRVDSITDFALVNDINRSVTVDAISSSIIYLIGSNDVLLNIATPYPQTNFTPAERTDIEGTLRAATTGVNFFGVDAVQAIADDVFFDVDGAKTPTDQVAYVTFDTAAQSGGPTNPPVFIQGRVTVPKTGGVQPLAGVTVALSTLSINPLLVAPIPGYSGVTDANGNYSLQLPNSVTPGSTAVNIVVGDLTYNASGIPGAFNPAINKFSIGAFVTSKTAAADVDISGRVAMSLLQIPAVPIGNFTPLEMDQLIDLVRTKLTASPVALANKTLEQVFVASFNAMVADSAVIALLNQIKDAEAGLGNSLVTASPTTLPANGIAVSTITVEPRDAGSQRVGPGLLVELSTTRGTVTTPAIDNHDGTYTAFLTSSTTAGTATVTARVEGAELTQKPTVTMTADTTAPSAPLASRMVFTGVGANAATIVGLPGAAEALSTLTVQNTTRGVTGTFAVSSDGSFRADINASAGNSLLVRATDLAGNTSTNTAITVPAGVALPAIGNPSALPGGLTAGVTPLAQAGLGVAVPAGFTFLRGFTLTLTGSGSPTAPLDVAIDSGVAVPAGQQLLLVQTLQVSGATQLRVVGPAQSSGGTLSPVSGTNFPGVVTAGNYAYLAASTAQSFVYGTVAGSRGAVKDVDLTVSGSTFVDLTRVDGSYLLAGPVGTSRTIGAKLFAHVAAQQGTTRLPYGGAKVRCDFTLATRANVSFAFTGRFAALGQNTRRMALTPSGAKLYAALNDVGDLSILDTTTLTQVSLSDDSQNLSDLAFSPNGFEAFIGYLNRVRDFTVAIEEPGLLFTGLGFPQDVAITPNSDVALIASSVDNVSTDNNPDSVHFIDTFGNVVQAPSVAVNADPRAIAVNRAGTRAYVVSRYQSALTVIDLAAHTVRAQFSVGSSPTDVAVAPDDSKVYVSDAVGNTVTVLSAAGLDDATPSNEVIGVVSVGAAPGAIALTPDGATLLVAEQQDDTVSLINTTTRTVTAVWATVDVPADVVVHPTGKTAYVLDPLTQKGILEVPLAATDTTAPVVLDAGPQDRAGQLLQDSPLEVVFTEKMNNATFTLANVQVTDAGNTPLAGTLASAGDGVTVVFTPSPATRYALNSTVKVTLTTALTDSSGVALAASVLKTIPTVTMQLPDLAKISITLTASGVEVNGAAGAVHPSSSVEVTNTTAASTFTTTAAANGSFHLIVTGLNTDTYQLVTSIFGGRAKTNAITLPVNFTISFPNPALISYQPGPAGTLLAVGAAGAVDSKSSLIRIRNVTTGQNFDTTTILPNGSFSVGIFASAGDSLQVICTLLGSLTLNPVALPSPNLPAPVIDFITPDRFTFGDAVNMIVVGRQFGATPGDILLRAGGVARSGFTLGVRDEDPSQQTISFTLPAGTDSGSVTVAVAGQTSNVAEYFSQAAANTSPFAEQVMAASGATNPNAALGASDNVFASLAAGGSITLRIGSTIEDGPGNDFQVFEDTSDGADCYQVAVSASSAGPFDPLVGPFCGTAFVNLSGHGPIRFVRITDANDGGPAAKIDAVFAVTVKLVANLLVDGQPIALSSPEPKGLGDPLFSPDVSAAITPGDAATCINGTAGFSVAISPPPQGGGGYGGGCTDTVTWSVSGGGTVSPPTGTSTTFTAGATPARSTVKVTVTRTGNCTSKGSDTKTARVDAIKVVSQAVATVPADRARLKLGVGEVATASLQPTGLSPIAWSNSGGGTLSGTSGASVTYTAPDTAASPMVTATYKTATCSLTYSVVQPASETAVISSTDTIPAGTQGAGMMLTITVQPTDVSFTNVEVLEVPGPATGVTGYFTAYPAGSLVHVPNPAWIRLSAGNLWGDHAAFSGYPAPWSVGGFQWVIPMQWRVVGSGSTGTLPNRLQTFSINNAAGNSTVSKLGQSVTRSP